MKAAIKFFVIFAFIFSEQPITAKTAESAYPLPATGQSTAPGSVTRFEHLTIEDGLSQNAGLAVFQDSKGYLWIGTQDGLNRYDGYSFHIYKHDPEDPNSLSHNSILAITEDKDGFLWIGTWGGGLNRFDPSTEKFVHYRYDAND